MQLPLIFLATLSAFGASVSAAAAPLNTTTGVIVDNGTGRHNMINGQVPPMTPSLALQQTVVLDDNTASDGLQRITRHTIRAVGTRAPIHTHPYGGQTCIIKGEMTLYLDGALPVTKKAGECYWMPAGPRMSGVNTGDMDAHLYDIFVVPAGKNTTTTVEPGFDS